MAQPQHNLPHPQSQRQQLEEYDSWGIEATTVDNKEKERVLDVQNEAETWLLEDEIKLYHRRCAEWADWQKR